MFDWNAVEKATQIGAREAVIRDPVAIPIKTWFECNPADPGMMGFRCADPAGGIRAECDFGTVVCTSTGCTRNGSALDATKLDQTVFTEIVTGMQAALPRLLPENVTLTYKPSELGFIGKPDGPVPEVKAEVGGVPFDLYGLDIDLYQSQQGGLAAAPAIFGVDWTVPTLSVTLTGEDISDNSCADQGLNETTVDGRLVCQGGGGGGGGGGSGPVCF